MSAHLQFNAASIGTAADLAQYGHPIGYNADGEHVGNYQEDAIDRVARFYHRKMVLGDLRVTADRRDAAAGRGHDRRDGGVANDAAEVFWTNALQQEMSTIVRGPTTTAHMTGPNAILPIMATLRPGQTEMAWNIESPTGGAAFVEPGAMRKLPMVGEFSERVTHGSAWTGIGYNVDLIEGWQAAEKGGTPLIQSRAANAMATLGRFNERVALYGDPGHELSGLLKESQSYVKSMGSNMISLVANADGAQVKLQIMQHMFNRIASTYGGRLNTVVAPETDLFALQRMRWADDRPALPDFQAMHPWLNSVRWIDGLQTAASSGGPLWIGMDVDPTEFWLEMSPAPLLYGPFGDGVLGSSWALITHQAGVILRRRERQLRYEYAA